MIKIGDTVECRYFNTPEQKFYGEIFQADVVGVISHDDSNNNLYIVQRPNFPWTTTLKRKEIKRAIK
jgi:hypothetical protein